MDRQLVPFVAVATLQRGNTSGSNNNSNVKVDGYHCTESPSVLQDFLSFVQQKLKTVREVRDCCACRLPGWETKIG